MKTRFLLIVLSWITIYSKSYALEHLDTSYFICRVNPIYFQSEVLQKLLPSKHIEIVSEYFQLVRVRGDHRETFPLLTKLKENNIITSFRKPQRLYTRATPNDSLFSKQTHHLNTILPGKTIPSGINSVGAWDFSTSPVTANGDTIVVAVIDEGFDLSHEDIDYFKNRLEIPGDSVDNDGNGAIDDYAGWNAFYNYGNINSQFTGHGMMVSGLIAAKGNNQKGIAGVAWNCKILPVNGILDNFDGITYAIKAYEYIIHMRKLYKSSNKQKGAYIVAVNFSIGTQGEVADFLDWAAVYDSLAKVGILPVNAVENKIGDAEVIKDLPTLFNRSHMINTTTYNDTTQNTRTDVGAHNTKYVHIAAPADNYSTKSNHTYGKDPRPGTSFAAPLVTGNVALLYSNACKGFLDSLEKNPYLYSLKLRSLILQEVDKTTPLSLKVQSGGKLNVFKAASALRKYNDTICKKASINITFANLNELEVYSFQKNIYLKNPKRLPLSVAIFDLTGREISSTNIRERENEIPCQNITEGIYIIHIQSEHTTLSTKLDLR